jgi:hypothetical protein
MARRLRREERGAVLALVAVLAVGLVAIASFVVDYGRIKNAHKELQAATDAAALAAAQDLPDAGKAVATAKAYSAARPEGTKGNTRPDLMSPTIDVETKCLQFLKDLGLNVCPNAVKVSQSQNVKLLFLGGLGVPGIGVGATSTAAMKGGLPYPLDVMIVLDRTGSMSSTKMNQARLGVRTFLSAMRPSSDKIGLALFPPSSSGSCNYSEANHPYEDSKNLYAPNGYVVVPLSSDFRTSDEGPLNNGSKLVQSVSGSCPSAGGITAYTTAIRKGKDELVAHGRPDAQDVIIFFTDGEANYGPCSSSSSCSSGDNSSTERRHPCQSAIDLVNGSYIDKNGAPPAGEAPEFIKGTWVYTILYGSDANKPCLAAIPKPSNWGSSKPNWDCLPTTPNQSFPDHTGSSTWTDPQGGYYCQELPHIFSGETLFTMASTDRFGEPRYYSSSDDLTGIFKRIAIDLSSTRLLPDNIG